MPEAVCPCGATFVAKAAELARGRKFCSRACYKAGHNLIDVTCPCGQTFRAYPREQRTYCAPACTYRYAVPSGRTHGLSSDPLYRLWIGMKRRCDHHPRYLARGIRVCDQWRDDPEAFIAYVNAHLGPRPPDATLDRIDNDRGYEPGNLRWADRVTQAHNVSCSTNTTSGRLGVSLTPSGRWVAQITRDRQRFYLGLFDTPDAAAAAYAFAAAGWEASGAAGIEASRAR